MPSGTVRSRKVTRKVSECYAQDLEEEVRLVAELMVERSDRTPRGPEDVVPQIGADTSLAREGASTHVEESAAGLLPRFAARPFGSGGVHGS